MGLDPCLQPAEVSWGCASHSCCPSTDSPLGGSRGFHSHRVGLAPVAPSSLSSSGSSSTP